MTVENSIPADTSIPGQNRIGRLILVALPVAAVLSVSWLGVFTFVNGYIVKELGHSNKTWTAAALWFSGGMVFWPIPCTEIAARLGRRRTVTLSLAVACLFYFAIPFTRDLRVIGPLLALMAFVCTASNVTWLPMVAEAGRNLPGRTLIINQIVAALVGTVILTAGGYLIEFLSYRTGFLIFALACGISCLLFHAVSRPMDDRGNIQVVSFRNFSRRDLLDLAVVPFIVVIFAGTCMGVFNYHTINSLFPNLARDLYAVSEKGVGLIVALGKLPALVVLLILVRMVDRLNIYRIYGLGIVLAGAIVLAIGCFKTLPPVIACYLLFYVFHGSVWGTEGVAINASVPPRLRDSAFAAMSLLATLALFGVGVVHNRMLAAGFGLREIFELSGACGIAGGLVIFAYSILRKKQTQPTPQPAPIPGGTASRPR